MRAASLRGFMFTPTDGTKYRKRDGWLKVAISLWVLATLFPVTANAADKMAERPLQKNIQRPDQLKGKAVAVSRVGSSSDFATRYALDKYGLVPTKDVSILEIGTQPDRFAALESGRIQGVMLEVPLTLQAKKMGFRVL